MSFCCLYSYYNKILIYASVQSSQKSLTFSCYAWSLLPMVFNTLSLLMVFSAKQMLFGNSQIMVCCSHLSSLLLPNTLRKGMPYDRKYSSIHIYYACSGIAALILKLYTSITRCKAHAYMCHSLCCKSILSKDFTMILIINFETCVHNESQYKIPQLNKVTNNEIQLA